MATGNVYVFNTDSTVPIGGTRLSAAKHQQFLEADEKAD